MAPKKRGGGSRGVVPFSRLGGNSNISGIFTYLTYLGEMIKKRVDFPPTRKNHVAWLLMMMNFYMNSHGCMKLWNLAKDSLESLWGLPF